MENSGFEPLNFPNEIRDALPTELIPPEECKGNGRWFKKYQGLLKKVTIWPKGLTEIVICNLNGIAYCFIIEFQQEYQLVQHELTN